MVKSPRAYSATEKDRYSPYQQDRVCTIIETQGNTTSLPECSMLSCMQSSVKCRVHTPNSSSPGRSHSMAHLRALRDTGNTCHGTPDLGEGSSRAHACTTCPWNAKRQRQDYGCTCMCGDSRGCPTSNGDKQAIRLTHRVHAEL